LIQHKPFNAGTSDSRDEYIGASTLFIPLNRRLQIGVSVPFVDSLQGTDVLPSETSFGDVIITPQLRAVHLPPSPRCHDSPTKLIKFGTFTGFAS
jgi:hypothetical protein